MKLTNNHIYTYTKQLIESFQDSAQYLPIKLNFFIQKNKEILLGLTQEIEKNREEIIRHYADVNDADGSYTVAQENVNALNSELYDLGNIEQEVEIRTIKFDTIPDDISLTTGQMEAIMFMID